MRNIEMKVNGNKLVVEIDLSKGFGPSKSGKTVIVASTDGPVGIPAEQFGKIKIGINVYKERD